MKVGTGVAVMPLLDGNAREFVSVVLAEDGYIFLIAGDGERVVRLTLKGEDAIALSKALADAAKSAAETA